MAQPSLDDVLKHQEEMFQRFRGMLQLAGGGAQPEQVVAAKEAALEVAKRRLAEITRERDATLHRHQTAIARYRKTVVRLEQEIKADQKKPAERGVTAQTPSAPKTRARARPKASGGGAPAPA